MKAKRIPGFEDEYVVSMDGRIFRIQGDGFKEISQNENDDGYMTVVLYKDGKPHFKYVHNLVATVYHENPDDKTYVNHKDGDKSHNSADNLSWADGSENTQHAYDHGLATPPKGEKNGKSKLTRKQVARIKKSDETGTKLADLYDVTPAAISSIRNGHRW